MITTIYVNFRVQTGLRLRFPVRHRDNVGVRDTVRVAAFGFEYLDRG